MKPPTPPTPLATPTANFYEPVPPMHPRHPCHPCYLAYSLRCSSRWTVLYMVELTVKKKWINLLLRNFSNWFWYRRIQHEINLAKVVWMISNLQLCNYVFLTFKVLCQYFIVSTALKIFVFITQTSLSICDFKLPPSWSALYLQSSLPSTTLSDIW